jgi:tRNA 2-thiouridine synthesizing protein A
MIENNPVMTIKEDQILDAKGLNCPLPILKTKVLLNKMQAGEILYVEATDPHSIIDFEAYCARTNHKLLNIEEDADLIKFYIQRAENPKKI